MLYEKSGDAEWRFERIEIEQAPWTVIEDSPDRSIYKTKAWMRFVAENEGSMPVVIRIQRRSQTVGYFFAMLVTRYDQKILASAVPGSDDHFRSAALFQADINKERCLSALRRYLTQEFRCTYTSTWVGDLELQND